jgi:hypothetical protein
MRTRSNADVAMRTRSKTCVISTRSKTCVISTRSKTFIKSPSKKRDVFNKKRPGPYQIHESDKDKRFVNSVVALFMSNVIGNIINLDNVKMLTTKALIDQGINPDRITTVEYNKDIFKEMPDVGSNIIYGKIEDYIDQTSVQKIGGVYFDFNGNNKSLEMFNKGIVALAKHDTPKQIKIATTFSTGRRGKMSEPEIYDNCLDIMEEAFPGYYVEPRVTYTYRRIRGGLTMHHQHYILHMY